MKLEIAKDYYVNAEHLKMQFMKQDYHRCMQNTVKFKGLEKILVMNDLKFGQKLVVVIPATVHEISTDLPIGKIQVKVCVDLGPFEAPLFVVVDSDKIYEEVSKPGAMKKVDNSYNYVPKRIIYNNPATIVFWRDGTKTVVKKNEKEKYNSYNAFCAALAKKIFGTNSEVNRIVRSGYNQKVAEGQKKLAEFKKKVEKARKAKKKGEKK